MVKKKLMAIWIIGLLAAMVFMPMAGENVEADTNIINSDGLIDGHIFSTSINYANALAGSGSLNTDTTSSLFIGQLLDVIVYRVERAYLSFNTTSIPTNQRIISATLNVFTILDISDIDFNVDIYKIDYGASLTDSDWGATGTYQGSILNTSNYEHNIWVNFNLNKSSINTTGRTQFILNSSREGISPIDGIEERIVFGSGNTEYAPYITIQTITETEAIITYNFTAAGMTNRTTNIYPVEIIDWGATDLYRYEFWSSNQTHNNFTMPDNNFTYLSINPYATVTQIDSNDWQITDLMGNCLYWIWFTRNKTAYCDAFITLTREAEGEGIPFGTWDIFINEGSDTDEVNMTTVNDPEIQLTIGTTYTLSAYDYFPDSNFITNHTFIAINSSMDVTFPIPYGPLNFFSYRTDFTAFRIWYNAVGTPYQNHIPPETWFPVKDGVRGGNYVVAIDFMETTINGTIAIIDTYFLNITINTSVAYSIKISNDSVQTLITTVDGITITLAQYDIYFTPSQQNIYYLLPGMPVGGGTRSTLSAGELAYVWRHPHKIVEADIYDVQNGTQQYFDRQVPVAGTVRFKSDTLYITGDIFARIFINSTTTNLVNYTGNPGMVDLTSYNEANISVWSNTTLTCNRMSEFRQVEIFYWMYYPDTLKYTIGQTINNSVDNQWTNVYWFLGFATNDDGNIQTADTTTIKVHDVDNGIDLDLGNHYDVTQAGIEMYFEYLNTTDSKQMQFTYYLDNRTAVPQSTPIISIRSYSRGQWAGVTMYQGNGLWVNNRTAPYLGDIDISLKNLNGNIDSSSIVVYDKISDREVPDEYYDFGGSTISLNADATGSIATGEVRDYEIYFLYQYTDVEPFFLFESSLAIGWIQLTAHLLIFIVSLMFAGYGVVELVTARKQKDEAKGFGWVLIGSMGGLLYVALWILHQMGAL